MPKNGSNDEWSSLEEKLKHQMQEFSAASTYSDADQENDWQSQFTDEDQAHHQPHSCDSNVVIIHQTSSAADSDAPEASTYGVWSHTSRDWQLATVEQDRLHASGAGDTLTYTSSFPDSDPTVSDEIDDVILGQLHDRKIEAVPGELTRIQLTVINNGERIASFAPQLDAWMPPEWVSVSPSHSRLHPGERTTFHFAIQVPQEPSSVPGSYAINFAIASPAYPDRRCVLGAIFTILSYARPVVGQLQPSTLHINWRQRNVYSILPISNEGNDPIVVGVAGEEPSQRCRIEFINLDNGLKLPMGSHFTLHPGQTQYIPMVISCDRSLALGVRKDVIHFGISCWLWPADTTEPTADRSQLDLRRGNGVRPDVTVHGRLIDAPLVGAGTLFSLIGAFLIMSLAATGAVLLLMLLVLPRATSSLQRDSVSTQLSSAAAYSDEGHDTAKAIVAMEQPQAALQLSLSELTLASVIEPFSAKESTEAESEIVQVSLVKEPSLTAQTVPFNPERPTGSVRDIDNAAIQPNKPLAPLAIQHIDGIPVVSPEMVTSPDEYAAIGPGSVSPTPPSESTPDSVAGSELTYEQLFRAVGQYYGLDWRLLAAQAYVESSFNPLALGKRGDLGLMQILPSTWHEWAPKVGVQDPFDSYSNVLVAAAYLDYLRSILTVNGRPAETEWILIAYNWGPNQLREFLEAGGDLDSLTAVRRKYATDVLRIAQSLPYD